jgi:hypothetical protein
LRISVLVAGRASAPINDHKAARPMVSMIRTRRLRRRAAPRGRRSCRVRGDAARVSCWPAHRAIRPRLRQNDFPERGRAGSSCGHFLSSNLRSHFWPIPVTSPCCKPQ